MTGPLLRVDGLTAGSPGPTVRDIHLTLSAGRVTALLGANGAGRTTLLRAILGLVPVAAGSIVLDGRDLAGVPTRRRAALGIAWCPEGRRLFPGLTVEETLAVASTERTTARRAAVARMLEQFPALADSRHRKAWTLSGGQQQMLAIGRALMQRPRLLLLDEPSQGLAPRIVEELAGVVRRIAAGGTAVLLAEQSPARGLAVADDIVVLHRGRMALSGRAVALTADSVAAAMLTGPRDTEPGAQATPSRPT